MENQKVTVIKRYANRKLYCTASSRYVTLSDITQMVCLGEDVLVIDNKTKTDITAATLTQAIHETEMMTGTFRPVADLKAQINQMKR